MAVSEKDIELIERFLANHLTKDELALFEEKKAASAEFKAEINFQKKVLAHIQAEEKAKLKSEMLKDFRTVRANAVSKPKSLQRIIPWAIAATLLILSTFYLIFYQKESSQDLFEAYFEPYDGVTVVRGDEQSLSSAMGYYNTEEYAKALEVLLKIEDSAVSMGQLQLLISSCYLKTNEPAKALRALNKIEASESASIIFNKAWYLAMTSLYLNQTANAKIQLEQIAKSSSMYASEAQTLLEHAVFK